MRTRSWIVVGLALASCLAAPGCSRQEEESSSRLLVWRMPSGPNSLDPARASNSRSQAMIRRTHEGLLVPDPSTGAPTAGLAERWEISSDGLRYVFHLRRDVVFDDGRELTARDVVFSLSRHFDPEVRSTLWPFLESVQGGVERLEGRADEVRGFQAPDDHTVVVELSSPFAPLLSVLSMAQAGVVPAGALPGANGEFPGTGAFRVTAWERGRHLDLASVASYRDGPASLPGVRFLFVIDLVTALAQFEAGEIDVLDGLPAGQRRSFKEQHPGALRSVNGLSIYSLGINHDKEPLGSNALLRRALAFAVDRRFICDELNEGKDRPATQLLPPEMIGHNRKLAGFSFDLEQTSRLLLQAGYPGGRGLDPLRVLYSPTDPVAGRLLERLQSDLAEVGVVLELETMEFAAISALLVRGREAMEAYDLFRLVWDADYPDPDAMFRPLLHSSSIGQGANLGYHDETLDLLLEQGLQETDASRRASLYRAASHRVEETVALIPIYWKGDDVALQPSVQGIQLGLLGEAAIPLHAVRLVEPAD